jgi:hypothetical protein
MPLSRRRFLTGLASLSFLGAAGFAVRGAWARY